MTFALAMEATNRYLEQRDLGKAIEACRRALTSASDNEERSAVFHVRGVILRLTEQLDGAEDSLLLAVQLVESTDAKARIQRELGVVYFEQAIQRKNDKLRLERASTLFYKSFEVLTQNREMIEASVSYSYYGRVLLLQGDRKKAIDVLQRAHSKLHGHNNAYEFDNLVWLARASFIRRVHYLDRAWELSQQLEQPFSWKEYFAVQSARRLLARLSRR